ncbi:hypothetical protein G7K_1182-t1 [Saitoella complicata NRRL Y-17804]|uniref:RNA methyltransferase n=1 Tax=Saitoella complicata (strain BCRC 22490 / CBS 7301 / JCM 7358 / NBRC 10748 / NRRL Y-17804) TaxID=698492 RepID=A0A0E9NC34_SAICN|nr:hypothetical protein G7K_1182-t1 [Saitoella complicata NRRL Y-17804]
MATITTTTLLLEMFGDGGLDSLFLNKNVLDVGCNEGRVTCAISQHLGARHVKGVDIDPFLIRKAKEYKRKLYSRQKTGRDTQVRFFPLSSLDKHGLRPLLDAGDKVSIRPRLSTFPENTDFVAQDWLQTPLGDDEEGIYDVVLALSLTKWIHLNSFDAGLKSFFDKCLRALRPGGHFIVEPQPWPSYVTAVKKKCRALASNLDKLEMRPENGFGGWLLNNGWEEVFIAGGNEEGKGFDAREIRVYRKPLDVTALIDEISPCEFQNTICRVP